MNPDPTPFNDGRDSKGRFGPGWKGGPGRPRLTYARDMGDRHDAAWNQVGTLERLTKVIEATFKKAEAGDQRAAALVYERMGGPAIAKRVIEEIEIIKVILAQKQSNGSGVLANRINEAHQNEQ